MEKENTAYNIIENLDIPIAKLSYPALDVIKLNKKMIYFINKIIPQKNNSLDYNSLNIFLALKYLKLEKYIKKISEIGKYKNIIHINNLELQLKNESCYLNIIFQPIVNDDETINELIMIIHDVTPEISQNKRLLDTIKTQREFFSFISHEFKTPLSVINAAIQVLQLLYKDKLPKDAIEYLNKIQKSTLQQIKLVNNLLDITKSELGYLKLHKKNVDIVNLTSIIAESASLYAKSKEIQLYFSSELKCNIVTIDDEKYERILLNLLSNAIKFTPEGKSIYVRLFEENNNICLQVKDEGLGIPSDKINIIFDRFSQLDNTLIRNSEGTGIGLYLVSRLAEAMNGKIFVDSKLNVGSIFTIKLPKKLVKEDRTHLPLADNRLLQAVKIEFSNVPLE